VKADALVNCLERQLESDSPGSDMHLHCFRVFCLGCLGGCAATLAGLCLIICREPFCLMSYSCAFRESCRKAADVGRASRCDFVDY
jgi:hypothetical protein